jgi:hypothetical protein
MKMSRSLMAHLRHEAAVLQCGIRPPIAQPFLRIVAWPGSGNYFVHIHQAQIGLMHEGRRLKRLPRRFVCQLLGRQLAPLVVDQRQQLLGGVGVAVLDGGQDTRDLGHPGSLPRGERLVSLGGGRRLARSGFIDMRAQAEVPSALRTDTPTLVCERDASLRQEARPPPQTFQISAKPPPFARSPAC